MHKEWGGVTGSGENENKEYLKPCFPFTWSLNNGEIISESILIHPLVSVQWFRHFSNTSINSSKGSPELFKLHICLNELYFGLFLPSNSLNVLFYFWGKEGDSFKNVSQLLFVAVKNKFHSSQECLSAAVFFLLLICCLDLKAFWNPSPSYSVFPLFPFVDL